MLGWRERVLEWLTGAGAAFRWPICLSAIVLVSVADSLSGAEVAASLGYLLPIGWMGWCASPAAATTAALLAACAWWTVDLATRADEAFTLLRIIDGVVLVATFVIMARLVASLRVRLDNERRLAHTDALTGVHNRRAFWNAASRELKRCRRTEEPFSIAYLDLDGFKAVNDAHGHGTGDALLQQVATTLQQDLRQLDMVARLGGDEFALLLPGADAQGAAAAMARLRERLQRAEWRSRHAIDCSIGCLTVVRPPVDVSAIVARADQMMYAMKRAGRGRTLHEVVAGELPHGPSGSRRTRHDG